MIRKLWDKFRLWLVSKGLLPVETVYYIGGSDTLPAPL